MAFSDLDTRAINHIFTGGFVTTLTYTTGNGDDYTIPVLYSLIENPFENGRYMGRGMLAWIRAADIASPDVGDYITMEDETVFTVRMIDVSFDGNVWKLQLTSSVRATA